MNARQRLDTDKTCFVSRSRRAGQIATWIGALSVFFVACGGSDDSKASGSGGNAGSTSGGTAGSGSGGTAASGGTAGGGGTAGASGAPTSCYEFGRFPAPKTTLKIGTEKDSTGVLYHKDIQKDFPAVDFKTLDRLYIEAGTYSAILIGNLPERTAESPLVITNLGGQVRIGPAPSKSFGYSWVMSGGSHWVLTGRYDPDAQTGDEAFPGHRCGEYAASRTKYGFLSDDEFQTFPEPQNHMGLVVGEANAFELEYLEITRTGFAGIRVTTITSPAGTPLPPVEDVQIHDNYIHDTGGEGMYIGMTNGEQLPVFKRLKIYNNRVLRAANELLQVQSVGDGSEIHHNVFAFGALNWRNAFQGDQDNATQFLIREGDVDVHHNLVIGGMEALSNFWAGPQVGAVSGKTVLVRNNFFSDAQWLGFYMGGTGQSDSVSVNFEFNDNVFARLEPDSSDYGDYYPARVDPDPFLFRLGGSWVAPLSFKDNRWSGPRELMAKTPAFVTSSGNKNQSNVTLPVFKNSGYPGGVPWHALEFWVAAPAPWAPSGVSVSYQPGDLVMDDGKLYECTAATKQGDPSPSTDLGGKWKDLGRPVDDVRVDGDWGVQ